MEVCGEQGAGGEGKPGHLVLWFVLTSYLKENYTI